MENSKLSILFPAGARYKMMPVETWHDLGMDILCDKVGNTNQEKELICQIMTGLTDDPKVARFRCDVFEDIYTHPEIRQRLMKLLDHVKLLHDYSVTSRLKDDGASVWLLLHRLDEYNDYVQTVEAIRDCLADKTIKSDGLKNLKAAIEEIYSDHGFGELKKDVKAMKATADNLKSMTVGINLNERFEAVSMGLVSVNSKPFTHANLLKNFITAVAKKDELHNEADWNGSHTFYPASADAVTPGMRPGSRLEKGAVRMGMVNNPIMAMSLGGIADGDGHANVTRHMDSAASMLITQTVNRLKELLGKYLHVSIQDISELIPELVYYTRWSEFLEQKIKEGWTFCKAETISSEKGCSTMKAEGFYNLKLMLTETPQTVVPNDLDFDREKRVYILTGANRGGKTTVTQAIGQQFLMAQGGIFVSGTKFAFTPADAVLTHFPADEDQTMDLGRLGEECKRFREIYGDCTASSLLLLNETFSTTSFEEGYYIARDAIRAILDSDTRTIYNTHMHKLAYDLSEINEGHPVGKAVSLIVDSRNGEEHSFKIKVAPPEGKSFARRIAEKYGITYEELQTLKKN